LPTQFNLWLYYLKCVIDLYTKPNENHQDIDCITIHRSDITVKQPNPYEHMTKKSYMQHYLKTLA